MARASDYLNAIDVFVRGPRMVDIQDSGTEFHWSRPRIMGLVFGAAASPIFFAFAMFGHEKLGGILWFTVCIGLTIAYVRPTRFRKVMQRLIPTTAEKAESASVKQE